MRKGCSPSTVAQHSYGGAFEKVRIQPSSLTLDHGGGTMWL
ncbi:hypothetical protein [Thermogemmatispora carboxidivorans]|nr:hypothetical protein [Thermogemmatispora carboxidivorans]